MTTEISKKPVNVDTVTQASQEPEKSQPWAELGLKQDEYQEIKNILGRRPTSS
jgi:phosphoribosylformylglycinamidine (FGAM) synthase-like enzyme